MNRCHSPSAGRPPRPARGTAGTAAARAAAALALAALTAAAVAAGCAAPAAPRPGPPAPVASGTAASTPAAGRVRLPGREHGRRPACNPEASSLAPLPGPPQVTPGSFMATIKARGYLIAGVDQNTYHFEYLNPLDGQFEGFDIDMIRAVAQAIFGNPNKVAVQGDHRRRADTRHQQRQRRHRRPHDDDHLRPAEAGRLLQRLLRRAPAGPCPRQLDRDRRWPASPGRRCAPPRAPTRWATSRTTRPTRRSSRSRT